MSKVLVHDYTIPVKGVKKKIIYQFSDVHFTFSDELSSDAEKELADKKRTSWHAERQNFANEFSEPCTSEQLVDAEEHFESLIECAKKDGDALVITGDVFDYINEAHLRMFEKRFKDLEIPYVYACGNHEPTEDIPDTAYMAKIKSPVQTLDLGDLKILAFEDSKRLITREQIDALKAALEENVKIIVAMHIPIQAEHNEIHKSRHEYFRLNYDNCPAENLEFIELIFANTDKIVSVFAGHLHFLNVCELVTGLTQYVSSQGIMGNINRYTIGE